MVIDITCKPKGKDTYIEHLTWFKGMGILASQRQLLRNHC